MSCQGCYEHEVFARNKNHPEPYDLDAILKTTARLQAGAATLHGGEILLMPLEDLTRLCEQLQAQGYSLSLQTNGALIRDGHLELFKRFKVSLGVSLNGPGALNRDRRLGSERSTDATTARVRENIVRARTAGIHVGIITVLSKTNAGDAYKVEALTEWAAALGEEHGVWDFRFNPLHDDSEEEPLIELSPAEAAAAYVQLAAATFEDERRHWLPFREFVDNLWGLGLQPCWMAPCDVYATGAVHSVLGDGAEGNCLRTAKDGIAYLRAGSPQGFRQDILRQIPTEDGGCKGCRYVRVCAGGCPAEGEGGDWRNKSRFCKMYFDTYAFLERRLRGLLPNLTTVPDWTTNDEADLMASINNRRPLVSPINPMRPEWSRRPSTFSNQAREERKP
jgi:uncharacterized protein